LYFIPITNYLKPYQKASGKPLALAMGMNTVVALATLNKLVAKSLSAIFCDKVESC
jgi:hypothetical protein